MASATAMSPDTPPDHGAGSPTPGGSATGPKIHAPKNKTCPFCGDSFTSSSLGRHLDLYIKDDKPKAADGIHDVQKIREMRSNITRRQARKSAAAKREEAATATPSGVAGAAPGNQETPSVEGRSESKPYVYPKPSWEASGVMTDIPPAPNDGHYADSSVRKSRPGGASHQRGYDLAYRRRVVEDRTRLRATELALQEVLDSINAANARENPPSPFDYDFLGQTFASLCLRMLPKPPTLSATQVVDNPHSWPIQAPSAPHFATLRQRLTQRLDEFETEKIRDTERRRAESAAGEYTSGLTNGHRDSSAVGGLQEKEDFSPYYQHLEQAFNAWKSLPEIKKAETWHLEALRAFAREQAEHSVTKTHLARVEAEAAHLRLQVHRLSECQQPREFILSPPSMLSLTTGSSAPTAGGGPPNAGGLAAESSNTPNIAGLASTVGAEIGSLDKDDLIARWTQRVRTNAAFQKQLPNLSPGTSGLAGPTGIGAGAGPADEMAMDLDPMNGVEGYAVQPAPAAPTGPPTSQPSQQQQQQRQQPLRSRNMVPLGASRASGVVFGVQGVADDDDTPGQEGDSADATGEDDDDEQHQQFQHQQQRQQQQQQQQQQHQQEQQQQRQHQQQQHQHPQQRRGVEPDRLLAELVAVSRQGTAGASGAAGMGMGTGAGGGGGVLNKPAPVAPLDRGMLDPSLRGAIGAGKSGGPDAYGGGGGGGSSSSGRADTRGAQGVNGKGKVSDV